jgi:hypothetical protein
MPAEAAARRFPVEPKAMSAADQADIDQAKSNDAILKAWDMVDDDDDDELSLEHAEIDQQCWLYYNSSKCEHQQQRPDGACMQGAEGRGAWCICRRQ